MIRLGVVGAGRWGGNILRTLTSMDGCEVVRVYEPSQSQIDKLKSKYKDVEFTTSEEYFFKFIDDLDAVILATPISTHFALATNVIKSHKHLFIEKPITTSSHQSKRLMELIEKLQYKQTVMVGHIFLYNPAFLKVKEIVDKGELGKIKQIYSTRLAFGPIRTDVDAVIDIASHDISMCNFLLNSMPSKITAASDGVLLNKMNTCMASLHYKPDIFVNIYSSWLYPQKEQKFVVVGDKKMLVFDNLNLFEPVKVYNKSVIYEYPDDNSFIPKLKDEEVIIPKIDMGEPLRIELEHFLKYIKSGETPKSSLQEAHNVMLVLDDINKSILSNGTVIV